MEEIQRQKRVLDMMISMHSMMHDKYSFKSKLTDIFLFVSSAFLTALLFFDYRIFQKIGIDQDIAQMCIGFFSVIIFSISIITIIVKWKEKAENHQKAATELFKLLNECRLICNMEENEEKKILIQRFNLSYKGINESLIKIPDNKFNSLKSKHLKKVELSKIISIKPNTPLWYLKLQQIIKGFKKNGK